MKTKYENNSKGPRDLETISMLAASGSLEGYAAAQHIARSWKRIVLLALVAIVPLCLPFIIYFFRYIFGG